MANSGVMVIIFDLPVVEKGQRREYTKFKKLLRMRAYRQIQESVYVKQLRNIAFAREELARLDDEASVEGDIIAFTLTMTQYENITILRGENSLHTEEFKPVIEV